MLGAHLLPDGSVQFSVWAPRARSLAVRLVGGGNDISLVRGAGDVFGAIVPAAGAGTRYFYVIDGERARPDPRSRFQPDGVHGPSQVVDPSRFIWRHAPPRRAL